MGGDDILTGGTNSGVGIFHNVIFGESYDMIGNARGGNDILNGGIYGGTDRLSNVLYGDATNMRDSAKGGDDIVNGGDNSGSGNVSNQLSGDANLMADTTLGGDDTLIGGDNSGSGGLNNTLIGDASDMGNNARGGNDILVGGDNSGSGVVTNTLIGDGQSQGILTEGGNDWLISGLNATDEMWGDWQTGIGVGGSDSFVFLANNGQDIIHDFRRADGDAIDLTALPSVSDFDVLDSNLNGSLDDGDDFVSVSGSNTVIDLGAVTGEVARANTVTILGINDLVAADFLLV